MNLELSRKLDLTQRPDRQLLAEALSKSGRSDAVDWIDEYLILFNAPEWRNVYGGGLVAGPEEASGYSIERLLDTTQQIAALGSYPGIGHVKAALRNPSQVGATVFEIEVATWCVSRAVHRAMEFSPAAGGKRPDLRWTTELGVLWCECKEARHGKGQAARYLDRLAIVAGAAYDDASPWSSETRIDVVLNEPRRNGIETRIRAAVLEARAAGSALVGEVEVTVRATADVPHFGEAIELSSIMVTDTPTRLAAESAYLRIVFPMTMHRRRHARRLLREARAQLPDEPSAVFLSGVGTGAAVNAAEAQIAAGTPLVLVSLWGDRGTAQVVHRLGQPFDARLLDPAPIRCQD